jgi:hypothetical protein
MLRNPELSTDFVFDSNFSDHVQRAIQLNPSAHDGAVAFGRSRPGEAYRCVGWSYRIVANNEPVKVEPNRGAAYNSALALSMTRHIDCVCLFSRDEFEIFVGGERRTVQQ